GSGIEAPAHDFAVGGQRLLPADHAQHAGPAGYDELDGGATSRGSSRRQPRRLAEGEVDRGEDQIHTRDTLDELHDVVARHARINLDQTWPVRGPLDLDVS